MITKFTVGAQEDNTISHDTPSDIGIVNEISVAFMTGNDLGAELQGCDLTGRTRDSVLDALFERH